MTPGPMGSLLPGGIAGAENRRPMPGSALPAQAHRPTESTESCIGTAVDGIRAMLFGSSNDGAAAERQTLLSMVDELRDEINTLATWTQGKAASIALARVTCTTDISHVHTAYRGL